MLKRLAIPLATASAVFALSGTAAADYQSTVKSTSGIASYWRLGESSGTTAVDSMNVRNGTYVNGVQLGQSPAPAGTTDTAARFDGTNDYVSFRDGYDLSGTASFSLEAWVQPSSKNATTVWRRILSKESSSGGYALIISPRDGRIGFDRRSSSGTSGVRSTTQLVAGRWYHVAVTYDGARLRLYLNGKLEGTTATTRSLPNTAAPLRLAAGSGGGGYLGGKIDDVAVYNAAIGGATVAQHYAEGIGTAAPAPTSPTPTPTPTPTATPTPSPTSGTTGPATTRPVGSAILADSEAAARVRRSSWEPRPENATANRRVPTSTEIANFRTASNNQTYYSPKVTGNFTGTTDEIIQWAAHKWGFAEDLIRAEAHHESSWRQSAHGDIGNGESYGLMQIKSSVWRGSYPLSSQATAFNVDLYGAILRHCYDGKETWMASRGYTAGDLWGCVGWYYSGGWKNEGAIRYSDGVRADLANRPWERY